MAAEQKGENGFSFLNRAEYFAELAENISRLKSGGRATVATMAFMPDEPAVAKILRELCVAAKRGVAASLAVDAQIFLINDKKIPGPLFYFKELPKVMPPTFKRKLKVIKDLRAAGVKVAVTNKPARPLVNPFSGRSHIKLAVINDLVYVGGCNLTHSEDIDLMVRLSDAKIADWLYDFEQGLDEQPSRKGVMGGQDVTLDIDNQTKILIDAGVRRQSIIYENALRLIDEAEKSLIITCQFFPNSMTAKRLLAAHRRGVKVQIYYNHPSQHGLHRPLHRLVVMPEKLRMPPEFFENELPKGANYLHAKLLASEKEAMVGSHNYLRAGVNFGTAETALLSRDPQFARDAIAAFKRQL
ncbi:MAG: phospholipase D-like domain-containing protein [Candidatus Saccharimonadales bacterium]